MQFDYETKVLIKIVKDFETLSFKEEFAKEINIKIKDLILFIDTKKKLHNASTEIYDNMLILSFEKNIINLEIISPQIKWKDIYIYKKIYDFYERM
tara:strand:- start:132 stop:419 length:288 start_codon:yes stop_codon:yes gene_type:complete